MKEPLSVCPGCGAPVQDQHEDRPGFIPPHLKLRDGVVCRRCFRMRHYGQGSKAPISDEHMQTLLDAAAAPCAGIVAVLDASDLSSSVAILPLALSLGKPLVVVINKADLLRRWIGTAGLESWARHHGGVGSAPVRALSALKGDQALTLGQELPAIFRHLGAGEGRRYLLLGKANVGKSTLLAAWTGDERITRSSLPGTTVGELVVPTADGAEFVDFPGFRLGTPWLPLLCPECLRSQGALRRFTRRTFILREGSSLLWGGVLWIRFLGGPERSWIRVVAFAPDTVSLHLTRAGREEELLDRHAGTLWPVPCRSCWDTLRPRMDATSPFCGKVPSEEKAKVVLSLGEDLAFPGLGWLTSTQGEGAFQIVAPGGVLSELRPALFRANLRRPSFSKRSWAKKRPHTPRPYLR